MAERKKIDTSKLEYTQENASWINDIDLSKIDDKILRIVKFYVIENPVLHVSSRRKGLRTYGWAKDTPNKYLINKLLEIAALKQGETLFTCKSREGEKDLFENANMHSQFYNHVHENRIALVNSDNLICGIFRHIRNALAHCRAEILTISGEDFFIFENGMGYNNKFEVKSRMVLKKETLIGWIDFVETGAEFEKEDQEKKRRQEEECVLTIIKNGNKLSKDSIKAQANMTFSKFNAAIGRLKDKGIIHFDTQNKEWKLSA